MKYVLIDTKEEKKFFCIKAFEYIFLMTFSCSIFVRVL